MFKLFRNKKGVSPLVATIFLMAFAVGLGAVVMQFSEGLLGGSEDAACGSDFQLAITNICSRPNILEFKAQNVKNVEISGIKILMEDMEGEGTLKKFSNSITKTEPLGKKIKFEGKIQAVQFVPMVKEGIADDAKIIDCGSRAITFNKDDIESC